MHLVTCPSVGLVGITPFKIIRDAIVLCGFDDELVHCGVGCQMGIFNQLGTIEVAIEIVFGHIATTTVVFFHHDFLCKIVF